MLTMLEKVRNYIERLISLYERERQRADSLAEELNSSRETVQALKEQIAELNRQIDNQKLASATMAPITGKIKYIMSIYSN